MPVVLQNETLENLFGDEGVHENLGLDGKKNFLDPKDFPAINGNHRRQGQNIQEQKIQEKN